MNETLFGKTLEELKLVAGDAGLPGYAAGQIAGWLYGKGVDVPEGMTNLPLKARVKLAETYKPGRRAPVGVQVSGDGTKKYLFETASGRYVETAMIPEGDRITVCVSTQVGCRMGCVFCMTGRQGFQGQLTAGEILNQVCSIAEAGKVTNIVYMGMGEPLDNPVEVMKSLEVFTAGWGFGMSPRRITVSTIGIVPAMRRFLERSEAHLAVSLHSPFPEERRALMPVQAAYPLSEVIAELRQWNVRGQRRVSFEYILFGGMNDTPRHVRELSRLLAGLPCRINLIRFHAIPGSDLAASSEATLADFKNRLNERGILTTIRASRGLDILAACGLLSTRGVVKNQPGEVL